MFALCDESVEALNALRGKRVVELGAGVGLLGIALAAFGAHVLVTDVAPVVASTMRLNIRRNARDAAAYNECDFQKDGAVVGDVWSHAVPLGRGSIVSAPLNWQKSLESQFAEPLQCDAVLGADVVFLEELVAPFCNTMQSLLDNGASHVMLAYRERGHEQSTTFCTGDRLVSELRTRQCDAEIVHSVPAPKNPEKNVVLYRIARKN